MLITLHIHYSNHIDYYPLSSVWAANLISLNLMRRDPHIDHIFIVDNETGEIYKTYTR